MDPTLGQIFCFASNFVPTGYLACDGTLTPAAAYPDLAKLLGGTFGGDGTSTFALPKLPPVATVSGAAMNWIMVAEGTNPDNGSFAQIGEVRPFALPPTPNSVLDQDWRKCDGRLLNIKGLEAMFSLVGTTFGGDGVTTLRAAEVDAAAIGQPATRLLHLRVGSLSIARMQLGHDNRQQFQLHGLPAGGSLPLRLWTGRCGADVRIRTGARPGGADCR